MHLSHAALMVHTWFQNLEFISFCIGIIDKGENVMLSGSHFSYAAGQICLKYHAYEKVFFFLHLYDTTILCFGEYVLL